MLAVQRHRQLLDLLEAEGSIRVSDLAPRLGVTEETIRRDLKVLEDRGTLARTHGGAVPRDASALERPHWTREVACAVEKQDIARLAAGRLRAGDTVLLDGSTSALFLARALPDAKLTVLTNSVQIALELSRRPAIDVLCTGGRLSPASLSLVGPGALQSLERLRVDALFFSCRGVDADHGLTDANEQQAALRRQMMLVARRKYLLADHTKFGVTALHRIAPLKAVDGILTDAGLPEAERRRLRRAGVRLDVATGAT